MPRILYGIQATGNGHITRALEIIPELKKYGSVDLLLSGSHSEIKIPYDIKYKFKGLGFIFGKNGGIDYWKTFLQFKVKNLREEISNFPIEKYDLVISDFEPVSAWASRIKKLECIGLSNQCVTLHPKSPKPKNTDWLGKMVLENYAPTSINYGLHFKSFDKNIFTPIIPKEIQKIKTQTSNFITVYLPAYSDKKIIKVLKNISGSEFQIFSKNSSKIYKEKNLKFFPIDKMSFQKSMADSNGVICNAGFGATSEALFLNKKLLVIPMKGQIEQKYNAAMLQSMGVKKIKKLKENKTNEIIDWIENGTSIKVNYPDNSEIIVEKIISNHLR
jgi:uncharacterized protein (TIGR00661 family)